MTRILIVASLMLLAACGSNTPPPSTEITSTPEEMKEKTTAYIRESLDYARSHDGMLNDSFRLWQSAVLPALYETSGYAMLWSDPDKRKPVADSLLQFIRRVKYHALLPDDYHLHELEVIDSLYRTDSLGKGPRRDAALLGRADILLSDAFVRLVNHLRWGRLPDDSVSQRAAAPTAAFYTEQWQRFQRDGGMSRLANDLEPADSVYRAFKIALQRFLDESDPRVFTTVPLPGKNTDSATLKRQLILRLQEEDWLSKDDPAPDSAVIAAAVKRFQESKGLAADGVAGSGTIRMLNLSDGEKFIRAAMTADRYKLLPSKMPERYLWVNLPAYYLRLVESDTVRLTSKIICGRQKTRTPLLNSAISEMITYPQWTVPTSIIVKEMLPAAKKDPGYFAKKGFSLLDGEGNEVDPYSVEWSKYSKGIPYRVVQGSGDANALGIMKFNFGNKYAVYLHDTNQRSLFGLSSRSLSHGCVRVQSWEGLMWDILKHDSLQATSGRYVAADSVRSWLERKEKKVITVRNRLPLFIRYFTCEAKDGKLMFYDDIYGEDAVIRPLYARK
ncbi:L,D-transpeptidase family protein [Nostoc ellipsosporum NOK]|nr:L,D-transpeptidase family protein [Nostoc ellipsosporum NOK]